MPLMTIRKNNINRTIALRIQNVIGMFCNQKPPLILIEIEDNNPRLQDWICNNLKTKFKYATGDSIISAAFEISISSMENGTEKRII